MISGDSVPNYVKTIINLENINSLALLLRYGYCMESTNTKILERTVDVKAFVNHYVDAAGIASRCGSCNCYGRIWSCPPYDFNVIEFWNKYSQLDLRVYQIKTNDKSWQENRNLIRKQSMRICLEIMDREEKVPGSFALTPGKCIMCGDNECSRINGEACRLGQKYRYSIESIGGDVEACLKDFFDIEILWERNGRVPEYYTLVCGLLY